MKNKSGQITIFVIAAIIIVTAIMMFFLFRSDIPIPFTEKTQENPESFLSSCMQERVKSAIQNISLHGGYPKNPLHIEFRFGTEGFVNISYLCYNQNNYFPCINQKPLLIEDITTEIENQIGENVQNCFDELSSSLAKEGYEVQTDYNGFDLILLPGKAVIQTDSEIDLTKSGETTKHSDLKVNVLTKLYEILIVVQEIINQESEFCNFDELGFNLLYPEFSVEETKTEDSTIYTINQLESNEKFRFAIRGCVIPPGI